MYLGKNPKVDTLLINLKKTDRSPDYYKYYPKLFTSFLEGADRQSIDTICTAGYLYYHAILHADRIIDDKDVTKLSHCLLLQEESIKLLTLVFGSNEDFWKHWNLRRQEHLQGETTEKTLIKKEIVSFEEYIDLADKKSAFGKIAIDCIWLLSNQKDVKIYEKLLLSHKHFSTGFQLCDDIKDIREDIEKKQFNWGVYNLRKLQEVQDLHLHPRSAEKLFYIKGTAQEVFQLAISEFQKAIKVISDLKQDNEWLNVLHEAIKNATKDANIAAHYIASLREHVDRPHKDLSHNFFDHESIKNVEIKKGLRYISSQYTTHYTELRHRMYLGRLDGFDNETQVHESDVFPRALLNDCLAAVAEQHHLDITSFLQEECTYLINQRNHDSIGGWSYFPTVKEIAADIDDLAQVIQLFIKTNRIDWVSEYCSRPIELTLADRILDSGGIETWIIPRANQTPEQKRQEAFNVSRWGKGPDVEVVANFVYSLFKLDAQRYDSIIHRATEYIAQQQNEDGHWDSAWYYGDYYGTYACLRILTIMGECFQENTARALDFIQKHQNSDGGFGLSLQQKSDPLSTALALLAYNTVETKKNNLIAKGLSYLRASQQEDGSWPAIDFIKPKLLTPYKSKTITTGLVLKSLCQFA